MVNKGVLKEVKILGDVVLYEYRGIRLANGTKSEIVLNKVLKSIDKLPEKVIKNLVDKDVLMRLDSEKTFTEMGFNTTVNGFYNIENIIYIKKSYFQKKIDLIVFHEVGHFIDFNLNDTDNFKSIVDEEFHNSIEDECEFLLKEYGKYFTSNILEVFAQSFYCYFFDKNFRNKCPKTVNMIEKYLELI